MKTEEPWRGMGNLISGSSNVPRSSNENWDFKIQKASNFNGHGKIKHKSLQVAASKFTNPRYIENKPDHNMKNYQWFFQSQFHGRVGKQKKYHTLEVRQFYYEGLKQLALHTFHPHPNQANDPVFPHSTWPDHGTSSTVSRTSSDQAEYQTIKQKPFYADQDVTQRLNGELGLKWSAE